MIYLVDTKFVILPAPIPNKKSIPPLSNPIFVPVLYCTALCCFAPRCSVPYCTLSYRAVLYCTVPYCAALFFAAHNLNYSAMFSFGVSGHIIPFDDAGRCCRPQFRTPCRMLYISPHLVHPMACTTRLQVCDDEHVSRRTPPDRASFT